MKRYNNTAHMFLCASADIYQTKVIGSHAGTDTRYTVADFYDEIVHHCKNQDHYDLLTINVPITDEEKKLS